MAESMVESLVARTPFSSSEELVDFVVENRRASIQKLASQMRLTTFEVRRLMNSADFRKKTSEALSLRVLSLEQEQKILEKVAGDALASDTRPSDRVKAAEFLLRQGGVERARETKVDVDHSVRVVFETPRLPTVNWQPPDPFAGVVGAEQLSAGRVGALPSPVEGASSDDVAEAIEVEFEAR
jgi:hypothetical protein